MNASRASSPRISSPSASMCESKRRISSDSVSVTAHFGPRQDWAEAAHRFSEVAARHGDSEAGAEAQYWTGVARYKESGDPKHLVETAEAFAQRFQDTPWAKKASVWAKEPASKRA